MDISLRALQQCRGWKGSTLSHGRSYNTNVKCQWGPSAKLLKKLPNASHDLIYIDGDHGHRRLADLEGARSKVASEGYSRSTTTTALSGSFSRSGRWAAWVVHAANEFTAPPA